MLGADTAAAYAAAGQAGPMRTHGEAAKGGPSNALAMEFDSFLAMLLAPALVSSMRGDDAPQLGDDS